MGRIDLGVTPQRGLAVPYYGAAFFNDMLPFYCWIQVVKIFLKIY